MAEPAFTSFPVLTSERLILRQLIPQDDAALFSLRADDEVNRYIGRLKQTDIKEARTFIQEARQGDWLYWAICTKESNSPIGTICLWNFSEDTTSAELGYELMPKFQGHGYMSEAVKAVLDYGFSTLGLQSLYAYTHIENKPSRRVLEKNNFNYLPDVKDVGGVDHVAFRLPAPVH